MPLWHRNPWIAYAAVIIGAGILRANSSRYRPDRAGVKLATGGLALVGVALLVTDGYLADQRDRRPKIATQ